MADQKVERLAVKVALDTESAGDPFYVNFAEVAAGQYDVELIFGRVPAKPSPEQLAEAQETATLTVPSLVKVVLPLAVLQGLRDAITAQMAAIEGEKK